MDKKKLNQYKALKKEIPRIQKKLTKLYDKQMNVPEVMGKVRASSKDFPYIESHVSVRMNEPREADRIKEQIRINEEKLERAEDDLLDIERFIASIRDSMDRQIIELVFLEGKTLEDAGEILGYTKGRISQKIAKILKD